MPPRSTATAPARTAAGEPAEGKATLRPPRLDVRSSKPYFLSRNPVKALVRRTASVAILILIDLSAVALGLYGALAARELYVGHVPPLWGLLWEAETTWLPFLTLVTVLVFAQRGLYAPRERRGGFGSVLSAVVLVALITLAFGIGTGHEFNTFGLVPTAVVLTAAILGLFRASYEEATGTFLRLLGVRRRALLVGHGNEVRRLHGALGSSRGGIRYEFVGAAGPLTGDVGVPFLGGLRDLPRILARRVIDEVIVADDELDERELLDLVELARRRGVRVRVAPKTTAILTHRAEFLPGQGVPLFELRSPVFEGTDWVAKRMFDMVVSGAVVLLGLPVWLLIALGIKASSPGPVFFRDRRVGVNEVEFSMLKFRTMYADAAERQADLEESNEAEGALFKIREDPRVTRVGSLLRRFSLDEIPQVLNVLRGEMSLVGPRPLPLRDYRRLEPWHRKRYLVLPGMTGLWQISGRSNLGFDELVRLDFLYLDSWSIWLDFSILLRTLPAVLTRRGAF